ncbi:uncharacterized protein M421DRAFT_95886 [Didymella exigua CBS 183.55]|uniref:Uncharacterized protein n=1 Tax=Didymella exigua CBS 183.55 TaxID=1150837 RepID=A0A6A5R6M1_9PLEO|nr:uncharacterized protein M421DRAFT_95886 [Didymella exigua CBS 183.55]KAF1923775.1 hypothetical protein M421DRAFT_95886 [Didymella exigua CBS 183.55]
MPFFTPPSSKHPSKKHAPVFAGLDDPFNFPTSKMQYNSRTTSPTWTTASTDSGHGSTVPLDPHAHTSSRNRRTLQKDGRGRWRVRGYGVQSWDNGCSGSEPRKRDARANRDMEIGKGDGQVWTPDPRRTFTGMLCDDPPREKEKWYTTRIYVRALERRERSEGATQMQRCMAPVLRRPAKTGTGLMKGRVGSAQWGIESAFRPPSPRETTHRGRARDASALLPSHPLERSRSPSPPSEVERRFPLRSPRRRSLTPLGILTSSERRSPPAPLGISMRERKGSVLYSCFPSDEPESDHVFEAADEHASEAGNGVDCAGSVYAYSLYARSIDANAGARSSSLSLCASLCDEGSAVAERTGVVLARTALVTRAHRVKVRSPGLKRSVDGA